LKRWLYRSISTIFFFDKEKPFQLSREDDSRKAIEPTNSTFHVFQKLQHQRLVDIIMYSHNLIQSSILPPLIAKNNTV